MPESLYSGTRTRGVELDSITARIAQLLYPDSTIHAKAFEETTLLDNFVDVFIGNVPFGNYTRASFRGFDICSRGQRQFGYLDAQDYLPTIYIRGRGLYSASLNASTPVGSLQSIEYVLRNLDKEADPQAAELAS